MIGFEVKVNGQQIEAALEKGVVSVILNRVKLENRDEIYIEIPGLNSDTREHLKWAGQNLKVGDTICIQVKDITEPSAAELKKTNAGY